MHNLFLFFREEKQHMTIDTITSMMDDAIEIYEGILNPISKKLGGAVCICSKWGIVMYYEDERQINKLADLLDTSPQMLDFFAGAEHNGFMWRNSTENGTAPTISLPTPREIDKLEEGCNQIAGYDAMIMMVAVSSSSISISLKLPKEEIMNLIGSKYKYILNEYDQIEVEYGGYTFNFHTEQHNFEFTRG